MNHGPLQLSLFDADRLRTGEAFEALAALDLERALAVFDEVLAQYPEAADAADGRRIAGHWRGVVLRAEKRDGVAGATLLWDTLKAAAAASPPLVTQGLRRAIAARVLDLLEHTQGAEGRLELEAPRLLIELGRGREAEERLKPALTRDPANPALLRLHGDALWAQGQRDHARQVYARALLLQPRAFALGGLPDEALADAVHRYGAEMTPVFGWIERILPLPHPSDELPNSRAVRLCRLLASTEHARKRGGFEDMVRFREDLRNEAPEVFDAYMDRLERSP